LLWMGEEACSMLLDIKETEEPRAYRLIGELDISNVESLAAVLERDVQGEGDVTLDLSELTFIDSSGIRALLRAMGRLDGSGKLVLLSPTASVRHVFSLMGVDGGGSIVIVEAPGGARQ
jgi:anti-anti-sigma factor